MAIRHSGARIVEIYFKRFLFDPSPIVPARLAVKRRAL
jgi:hypothetical protein